MQDKDNNEHSIRENKMNKSPTERISQSLDWSFYFFYRWRHNFVPTRKVKTNASREEWNIINNLMEDRGIIIKETVNIRAVVIMESENYVSTTQILLQDKT